MTAFHRRAVNRFYCPLLAVWTQAWKCKPCATLLYADEYALVACDASLPARVLLLVDEKVTGIGV